MDRRSSECGRCHNKRIAPLGYKATVEKYGEKFAVEHIQQKLLANPSDLEVIVAEWLTRLGVRFEREVWFETKLNGKRKVYLIDFVLSIRGQIVPLEVQGTYVHQFHAERDAHKLATLRRAYGAVVAIDTEAVKSGAGYDLLAALVEVK